MKCLSAIIKTFRLSLIDKLQLFTYRMNLLSTSFCSLQMVQEKKKEHTKYKQSGALGCPLSYTNASFLGARFPPHYMILVSVLNQFIVFILIILSAIFGRLLEWCNKKTC
jgi:hypothetical protein